MKSPARISIWQAFAQALGGPLAPFEMMRNSFRCLHVIHGQFTVVLHSTSCLPSPSLRSGLSPAGPTLLHRREEADFADHINIRFEILVIAVESRARTTNQRGSSKCGNPLSSLPSFRPRLPVACRTLHRAAWRVRLPVRPSPTRLTKTSSPGLPLARLPGRRPVASSSVFHPAIPATDQLADLAAFGRTVPPFRTIRADRPGGPLCFAKGKADV